MMKKINIALAAAALIGAAGSAPALARDEIRIVGSSTVYPFSTVVAERFGKTTDFKTPVVESTGTGGGFKLFCEGVGEDTPDISNASRAIKSSEVELCASNGVNGIIEVKFGYDGIVVANSKEAPHLSLTERDLFLALAKDVPDNDGNLAPNTAQTWADVNPDLPATKIEVLGPPPTSGTRDAFSELAMEAGCKTFDWVKELKSTDKNKYKAICHSIREDGAYVEAGENDNLIVQKLAANADAFGIFGFSFLDQHADKVQASKINGTEATFDNIADGSYAISRPLYFYVKKEHMDLIPGLKEYVAEYLSDDASGDEGYLSDRGLIPMGEEEHEEWKTKVSNFETLSQ